MNPSRKETEFLNCALIDCIVKCMLPHKIVEKEAFKVMLDKFRPGYRCPSARTVGRRILELYTIMIPGLKSLIENLSVKYSLAIDGWTNSHLTVLYEEKDL